VPGGRTFDEQVQAPTECVELHYAARLRCASAVCAWRMSTPIPAAWQPVLASEITTPTFLKLQEFLKKERQTQTVFPPEPDVYSALELTALQDVKVLLLGQDPYHEPNQAHGLSFSVRPEVKPTPPSLMNMFKELKSDVPPFHIPNNGFLKPWAQRGVLLLNTVLTVRAHKANSHKGKGWEEFTDAIIRAVNARQERVVFILLGGFAQKKAKVIDNPVHAIVRAAHPSPLSAKGFFGQHVFSKTNAALKERQRGEIDWQLPDLP
jgi:uracil-DNA glycosylase